MNAFLDEIKKSNENDGINFQHFIDDKGNKTNIAYVHGYLWSEFLDDYIIKCEIKNGKLELSEYDQGFGVDEDLELEPIEDSWEYIDFYKTPDMNDGDVVYLESDTNSEMFDVLNSEENLNNLNKNIDYLDKLLGKS